MGWNGKQCQLCGRFANHFYGSQEDDGSTTYADERCLTRRPGKHGPKRNKTNTNGSKGTTHEHTN